MSDSSKKMPAVKLTLSRETVKNLGVRTDVRTGYIYNNSGACVKQSAVSHGAACSNSNIVSEKPRI